MASADINDFCFAFGINIYIGPQQTLNTLNPWLNHMGPVKRKCVFRILRPGNIQTSLLSYRD